MRSLLEHGANIGMKNHFEELPIDFITPDMLERFFSEYCIKYDEATDVNNEKFEITFDYSFLAPPIGIGIVRIKMFLKGLKESFL